ncbi:MAG: PAS domain-containing protein [Desulfovibrionaceae bacterium]|nr:PAS domain-containing protein [Desulfovibrionaceae bacterium]MBF0514751.1 PAS domain-containing protein [Desulfovibrionaceae bacterium]
MLPLISSAYFHDFLESLGNGVLLCNVKGEVYAANRAASEILGLPGPAACIGRVPGELFENLSNLPDFLQFFDSMAAAGLPGRSFRATLSRDGQEALHLALSISRLIDSGKLFGLMIAITDISDVVSLHEREKRMLRKYAELSLEKHDSLRHFADAVAHQLRNPLMAIGGFAGIMLRKRSGDDPDLPRLTAIVESAGRLEEIVDAVAGYNALSLGGLAQTPVASALAQAVFSLSQKRPDLTQAADIREDVAAADLPLDQSLFATALEEILQNALEANPTGAIHVTGRPLEDRYLLSVADDGPGVDQAIMPFVFDFFFTTKARGVGMGLPRAQKIAREHEGALTLASTPNHGTTATFTLPLLPVRPAPLT